MELHTVTLSQTWQILGPFQIGTREAAWGADPLESMGGFHSLCYDGKANFKSSLAPGGYVTWTEQLFEQSLPDGKYACDFGFPNISWSSLQAVYGWPALQWQAWARSTFVLAGVQRQKILLHLEGVLELWVDDERFWGGDYYGLRRAPLALNLSPGPHQIDLRLIRDVRAMGAVGAPNVPVTMEFTSVPVSTALVDTCHLLPDIVHDRFVSEHASVTLTNTSDDPVEVFEIAAIEQRAEAHMRRNGAVRILPGQTRPLAFRVNLLDGTLSQLHLKVAFRTSKKEQLSYNMTLNLRRRTELEPHKVTFMHPGEIVSFAMVRLPSSTAVRSIPAGVDLPIMLYMHGSGVEADNDEVTRSFDGIPDLPALVLFVEGVTSWCSDDWHNWGWRDVEAALAAVPNYVNHLNWQGPRVESSRWIVTGHSNGGQGVWYALAHHPDRVIAAAPASGYSSIQTYVPYIHWSEAEPARHAVVQSVLNSYRHELLIPSNAKGIPLAIQHGSIDDNVPVFHARRMFELLGQGNTDAKFEEIPNKNHVFDGMMQTNYLRTFYSKVLREWQKPIRIPADFTVVVANPSDTGPKFGIDIEELRLPGRLGRVQATRRSSGIAIKTSNVVCFTLDAGLLRLDQIDVDKDEIRIPEALKQSKVRVCKETDKWAIRYSDGNGRLQDARTPHLGGLDAILRSNGVIKIMECHPTASKISKQISRNFLQYLGADSEIIQPGTLSETDGGSIVILGIGLNITSTLYARYPIRLSSSGIRVTTADNEVKGFETDRRGLGAVFLRPGSHGRLELIVWGVDEDSLGLAARLVPMMTGAGQPDFIVFDRRMMEAGIDGVLGLGFFDGQWRVPAGASFFM